MKQNTLFLIAAILGAVACGPTDGIRTIRTTTQTEANLGRIKEADGPVTVRLLCRNDYPDTLYPVQLHTPCGCTKVQFDRKPVPPGEDQVLVVTYDPAYRPGLMMESIDVYYRNSPVKIRNFVIKGEVIGCVHPIEEDRPYHLGEGLYTSHKVLHFGSSGAGQTSDMFFRFGNGNKKKADITFDVPEEWRSSVRMRQPGRMKADERDTLHVKFTMPSPADTVEFAIQPLVNGIPTQEKLVVKAYPKE